jgi:hypothetical protein
LIHQRRLAFMIRPLSRCGASHAPTDAFAVATFVPAQADFPSFLQTTTAFGVRKLLIDMSRAEDLRIRNAWVRGSNPLCGTTDLGQRSLIVSSGV